MATIIEKSSNLFSSSAQVLVNTVNTEGVMGRGIALEFRFRFPAMFHEYEQRCKTKSLSVGELMLWKHSKPWVLNFPTKKHWKLPSQYEYIERGLEAFCELHKRECFRSVAFPPLGSALGGLDWNRVRKMMAAYLEPIPDLHIEIIHYDARAADPLFDKLQSATRNWREQDFAREMKISVSKASLIASALREADFVQMANFLEIRGLGEKTISALYRIATIGGAERSASLFDSEN